MENITDIFKGIKIDSEQKNQIDTIYINWSDHAKGVVNIAKHIEPKFIVNKNNENVLKLLLLYFTGSTNFDKECETITGKPGSLNKGIMLVGGVGTGKSLMFRIFDHYTKYIIKTNSFREFTAIDIVDSVNVSGVSCLEQFSHNISDGKPHPMRCYIDDIASKNETVKHYGTESNVIEQLLSLRYNVFQRYGTLTHVSTNKFPAEMRDIYDVRIVDRMKEMYNIVNLSGESFRK